MKTKHQKYRQSEITLDDFALVGDKIDPCYGAAQIGSTVDKRAVWHRAGETFMVVHDAKLRAHILPVKPEEIVRRLDKPIPWEQFENTERERAVDLPGPRPPEDMVAPIQKEMFV